jgi:uncharacterized protein
MPRTLACGVSSSSLLKKSPQARLLTAPPSGNGLPLLIAKRGFTSLLLLWKEGSVRKGAFGALGQVFGALEQAFGALEQVFFALGAISIGSDQTNSLTPRRSAMKRAGGSFELTATDLVGYLNCRHLSELDRAVAEEKLAKPKAFDPLLEVLRERGFRHEQSYIDHLKHAGLDVVRIDGIDVGDSAVSETIAVMKKGAPVIAQGALAHQGWGGRADILRRVEIPSAIGEWSYEAIDTKLSRETKAGAVLQLCLYSDLLTQAQGAAPEHMHVVAPWSDFKPRTYRFADYAAYFREVKRGLGAALVEQETEETYPDPKAHCDICRWREECDERRRADDHLCLVAGISKIQINELKQHDIKTVKALAGMALPLNWKPDRGLIDAYSRICQQARLQVAARESGERKHLVLPVEPGFGLTRLPEPSAGDIFFDIEGDPFVGEHGLEYLFGYQFNDLDGHPLYRGDWAFSRAEERRAFEDFVDFVLARWRTYPDLHIYHYAPYEPAAMKRLMGRYATRQEEIDRFLRAGLFVDLFQVVRHAIRASVESYSIRRLEPFYGFERKTTLSEANIALANLQANLELDDSLSIVEETKTTVLGYNKDDCAAASALRDWLETLRAQVIDSGTEVPRPVPGDSAPNEKITSWLIQINALVGKLTAGVPDDPKDRTQEQQARWILAYVLDFHRREEKAVWWELFRLAALSAEDLLDEPTGLSGLTFVQAVGGTDKQPVHRYSFPPQETDLRGGEELRNLGGKKLGMIEAICLDRRTVDIRKRKDSASIHPQAVFAHKHVKAQVKKDALVRIGDYVARHGLGGDGSYLAARNLLLRERPRVGGQPLRCQRETTVEAAVRLCEHLGGGILPIQGPPGAGKTFTGARMICELVRRGKTVGVTATSHKVIRNLIDAVIEAADKQRVELQCCHKSDEWEEPRHCLSFARKNEDLLADLGNGVSVGGGTAWLWSRPDAFECVDVLFVDEAAQMSLADVLAVSHAAKTVVLIGDPQQLEQPMQGSHPDGTDVSALDHILAGERTIPPDKGLFLEETWRLHLAYAPILPSCSTLASFDHTPD